MEQAQPIEIRKSRNFGDQINVTFAFLRGNFKKLGKCVLYIVGPPALLAGALLGYFFYGMFSIGTSTDRIFSAVPYAILGGLFAIVTTVLLHGLIIDYVRMYLDRGGSNFDVPELWAELKSDLGKIVTTSLGVGGLVLIAYLLLIGLVVIKLAVVAGFLGVALVFAAIYAYVPLSMLITVRISEHNAFFEAIGRTFELVKGYWWMTFGVLAVPTMVVNFISGIFLFPAQMFISFARFSGVDSDSGGVMKLIVVVCLMVGMGLSYILAAVPALAATLQYFNLVEKHEGVGLMSRIEAIGTEEVKSDENPNFNTF